MKVEDVFDLREFILVILRKWRLILILTIVLALLGGAYKIVPGLNRLTSQAESGEQELYQLSLNAYNEQKSALENEIASLTSSVEELNGYMENSVLMKIDPLSKQVASFSFYVNQIVPSLAYQNPDYTARLVLSYAQAMQAGEMYEYIMDQSSFFSEMCYLQEAVQVSYNTEGGIVTVNVTGLDEKMCRKVLALAEEYVQQKQAELGASVAPHSIEIISEAYYTMVDHELETLQSEKRDMLTRTNTAMQEKKTALAALQEPEMPVPSKGNVLKSGIKFMMIGAVGGAGVAVLLAFFLDMMDVKVRSERQLRRQLKVRVLGTFQEKG